MAGVNAWREAGRILVEMYQEDEKVFQKIMERKPWITIDSLMTFMRIGRKELRPEVLLLKQSVQLKLVALPYDVQSTLLDTKVNVASGFGSNKEPVWQNKSVTEMTTREIDTVIRDNKLVPLKDQVPPTPPMRAQPSVTQRASSNVSSKIESLGHYRLVMRFGKPVLEKAKDNAASQRVLLANVMGDMSALIELTKWRD